MKTLRSVTLVIGCLFVVATGSAYAAKYKVAKGGVTDGGIINGRITYNGTPPAPKILKVDEDVEACGGDRPSNELVVSSAGGIKNVVLSIENIKTGKAWDFPDRFVYDQKGCTFEPRIIIIKPKMAGEALNSDSLGHNFHSISKAVFNVNKKIQPGSKMVVKNNNIRKSGLVRVKCDIHSWMGGHWIVAKNPYTVLTDADGGFTIADVPAGEYTLKIWHETLGESKQKVVVTSGGTTNVDASLTL